MLRCSTTRNTENALEVDECYDELGLKPGSSDAEVKAAWRRLSARWHPDRNDSPHALRKIQRINRALDGIRMARWAGGTEPDEDSSPGARPVGEHTVSVTLEEVVTGCTRELRGEVVEDCADCEGSGLNTKATGCGECDGRGLVRQHLWFAWVSPMVKCGVCQGHGTTRQGCKACAGSGKSPAQRYRCRANIPPGARTGDVLDVAARIQREHRRHDVVLRVRLQLQPHPLFSVEPDGTVKCEVPVDGFAWMANRWVEVPTPRGLQQMKLRRSALSYRIKGAGLPWQDAGAAGDCIITVVPMFPEDLTPVQEAAIDRLVATNSGVEGTTAGDRIAGWNRLVERWDGSLATRGGRRD
jgi:DnaJ-class molecular chaperone